MVGKWMCYSLQQHYQNVKQQKRSKFTQYSVLGTQYTYTNYIVCLQVGWIKNAFDTYTK